MTIAELCGQIEDLYRLEARDTLTEVSAITVRPRPEGVRVELVTEPSPFMLSVGQLGTAANALRQAFGDDAPVMARTGLDVVNVEGLSRTVVISTIRRGGAA